MNKTNYQKELDRIIESISPDEKPRLLLHACCAPCSSYVLEYLSEFFDITLFYYNPNISPEGEFEKRYNELKRLISEMPLKSEVKLVKGDYNYDDFLSATQGFENCREGGERCFKCYRLRLEETARIAKEGGFNFFCTTLSISPLKNSAKINEIGLDLEKQYGVKWLPSDFKKKEGYKRSIELSKEYNLYRQNFCGCVFSKLQTTEDIT